MEKYESIHGKDVSSFDFASTHRLPTISAAQAFDDLQTGPRQFIHTGLEALDQMLAGVSLEDNEGPQQLRGIEKGQIIEVWGPPASGKTTFALQIAANTLRDGCGVVWVDTFHPLCHRRLGEIMSLSCSLSQSTACPKKPVTTANLVHYSTPTLAHLIGLLCKPQTSSVPRGTSLIVIDGLSGLINRAFPKNVEPRLNSKGTTQAVRRLQVLQYLSSALQKLSVTQDLLIVVLSQCATRMQVERSATITPAINASTWEQGVATRLVLFQDWTTADGVLRSIRLVGVQKNRGHTSPSGISSVFPFEIYNGGLAGLDLDTNQPSLAFATNSRRQKRKFNEGDIEIADSEGEDYGWEDDDEAEMPNMPPQWQGSEDLLLGRPEDDDNMISGMSEVSGEGDQHRHLDSP